MAKPIFGTDITKPLPELIEGWRDQLAHIRGQIDDVQNCIGFRDTFEPMKGLLTCGIENLYHMSERLETLMNTRKDT